MRTLAILIVSIFLVGCNSNADKGKNRDKDVPKSSRPEAE